MSTLPPDQRVRIITTIRLLRASQSVLPKKHAGHAKIARAIASIQKVCGEAGHEIDDAGDSEHQVLFCSICGHPTKPTAIEKTDSKPF